MTYVLLECAGSSLIRGNRDNKMKCLSTGLLSSQLPCASPATRTSYYSSQAGDAPVREFDVDRLSNRSWVGSAGIKTGIL